MVKSTVRKPRPMDLAVVAEEKLDATLNEFFGGGVASRIRWTFDLIEIAEEEIEKAFPRSNGKPTDPPGLFQACCPGDVFYLKSARIYREHVRELIARSRGKCPDYSMATEAEVLLSLLEASKLAPLTSDGLLLAERLFKKLMGADLLSGESLAREQSKRQFAELLSEAKRKVKTGR